MPSRDYSRSSALHAQAEAPSATAIVEAREPVSSFRLASPRTETSLGRLLRRADPWLAIALVVLVGWAAWSASAWLLSSWQIH